MHVPSYWNWRRSVQRAVLPGKWYPSPLIGCRPFKWLENSVETIKVQPWKCETTRKTFLGLKHVQQARSSHLKSTSSYPNKISQQFINDIKTKGYDVMGVNAFICKVMRFIHGGEKIWILCSSGKNNISLVRCAHSWDIALATRT